MSAESSSTSAAVVNPYWIKTAGDDTSSPFQIDESLEIIASRLAVSEAATPHPAAPHPAAPEAAISQSAVPPAASSQSAMVPIFWNAPADMGWNSMTRPSSAESTFEKTKDSVLTHHFLEPFSKLWHGIEPGRQGGLEALRLAIKLTLKECHDQHALGRVVDLIVRVTTCLEVAFNSLGSGPIFMSAVEMNIFHEELNNRFAELAIKPFDFEIRQDTPIHDDRDSKFLADSHRRTLLDILRSANTSSTMIGQSETAAISFEPIVWLGSPLSQASSSSLSVPFYLKPTPSPRTVLVSPPPPFITEASLETLSTLRQHSYNGRSTKKMYATLVLLTIEDLEEDTAGAAPVVNRAILHHIPFHCSIATRNNLEDIVASKEITFDDIEKYGSA